MFFNAAKKCFLFFLIFDFFLLFFYSYAQAAEKDFREINSKIIRLGAKWVAGETSVSRLSPEEQKKRLGLNKAAFSQEILRLHAAPPTTAQIELPSRLNYVAAGYVTPVKEQGSCSSCWAFAMTAALESHILMNSHLETDLSEQTLVSCSGAGSCNGGNFDGAANFFIDAGLPPETCFPYTATNNLCGNACTNWKDQTYNISNWLSITQWIPSVEAIKNGLINYGPLVSMFEVYSDLFYYKEGIYSNVSGNYVGTHAIEIVGYNDATQSFTAKNSWGTEWGEKGFFRIAYSQVVNSVSFGMFSVAFNLKVEPQCTYTISPENAVVSENGENIVIGVSTQPNCVWNALSSSSWMELLSGSSGSGNGKVSYYISPNTTGISRNGIITIAGKMFTITQPASKITPCTAILGQSPSIHIPYLSYINPNYEPQMFWANFLYENNPTFSTQVFLKLTDAGVMEKTPLPCEAATLDEKFRIFIPDAVYPDGLTHIWMDLEYSPSLSSNEGNYFSVVKYGAISN